MPSRTRGRAYRPESPPPPLPEPKRKKNKTKAERLAEGRLGPNEFVEIVSTGDPPSIFNEILSYLDVYSLACFKKVHPSTRSLLPNVAFDKALRRSKKIPTSTVRGALPDNPLLRHQLWIKVSEYAKRMERYNSDHFFINDEQICRCNTKKKQDRCKLPNLFLEPFSSNQTQRQHGSYKFFVRISYRVKENDTHRLIWQGFIPEVSMADLVFNVDRPRIMLDLDQDVYEKEVEDSWPEDG